VQSNVGWNCLATACAVGTMHPLYTWPLVTFRFSFPSLLAGMGANGPDANFLVTHLGGLQF